MCIFRVDGAHLKLSSQHCCDRLTASTVGFGEIRQPGGGDAEQLKSVPQTFVSVVVYCCVIK